MDKRILVVDDDRLMREMARDALAPEGFEVVTVASAPAALEYLEQKGAAEIVITDLSMPEMDGLELLERLKREYPRTDVIVMTAYASLESALKAMRLGAAEYLRKPVKSQEIVYCVKRTVQRRRLLVENETLRGCVQTYEASRALSACLETNDILPLALDILARLVGRRRSVGRWTHPLAPPGEGTAIAGFSPEETTRIRDGVEGGKLFRLGDLDAGEARGGSLDLHESLMRLEIEDDDLMVLPLRCETRVVGGIWIFSEGRSFHEDERRRGELVAAQAELAFANAERFLQAREKAFIDDVTELYNARYLLAALDREVNRAERTGVEMSVLFLDLDHFKLVNDNHGHLVGSHVLRELGHLLEGEIRTIDTVARYGGDEFCVILVDTGCTGALNVAERIRRSTERMRFGAEHGLGLSITASIGVSTFPQHGGTRESLLDQADKAMYLGKSLGRNRVCSADQLTGSGIPRRAR